MNCSTAPVVTIAHEGRHRSADRSLLDSHSAPAANDRPQTDCSISCAPMSRSRAIRRPGNRLFEVLSIPEAYAHWNGA